MMCLSDMTLDFMDMHTMKLRLNVMLVAAAVVLVASLTGCEKNSLQYRQDARAERLDGEYAKAAESYRGAINRNPGYFEPYYWLGICQLKLDKPVDAQLTLERAWTLEPNDPEWTPRILDALAEAISEQGPDAEPTLFAFLYQQAEQYRTSDAFLRQGKYLAKAGDADNAQLAFAKAIRFADGSDVTPFIEAARFYVARRDKARAIEVLRFANYVEPGNDEVYALFREVGVVPGPTQAAKPPRDSS